MRETCTYKTTTDLTPFFLTLEKYTFYSTHDWIKMSLHCEGTDTPGADKQFNIIARGYVITPQGCKIHANNNIMLPSNIYTETTGQPLMATKFNIQTFLAYTVIPGPPIAESRPEEYIIPVVNNITSYMERKGEQDTFTNIREIVQSVFTCIATVTSIGIGIFAAKIKQQMVQMQNNGTTTTSTYKPEKAPSDKDDDNTSTSTEDGFKKDKALPSKLKEAQIITPKPRLQEMYNTGTDTAKTMPHQNYSPSFTNQQVIYPIRQNTSDLTEDDYREHLPHRASYKPHNPQYNSVRRQQQAPPPRFN
jgi:hypothetical protein